MFFKLVWNCVDSTCMQCVSMHEFSIRVFGFLSAFIPTSFSKHSQDSFADVVLSVTVKMNQTNGGLNINEVFV